MKSDFYICHKSIMPSFFEDVINAKKAVIEEKMSVSDACLKYNISRSTFYKYKDFIFTTSKDDGNKIVLGLWVLDKKGILSNILNMIAYLNGSISSINQDSPVDDQAYITLSVEVSDVEESLEEFLDKIKKIEGVKAVNLIAVRQ